MNYITNLEIRQMSLGYNKQGVFVIADTKTEQLFMTIRDEIRSFKTPSGAIAFLKSACNKYPQLGYRVKMPNGKVKNVGSAEAFLNEEDFGPHVWEKKNLVTLSDSSGLYDIMQCKYCKKEEKVHGLHRSLRSGTCPKNPIQKQ